MKQLRFIYKHRDFTVLLQWNRVDLSGIEVDEADLSSLKPIAADLNESERSRSDRNELKPIEAKRSESVPYWVGQSRQNTLRYNKRIK